MNFSFPGCSRQYFFLVVLLASSLVLSLSSSAKAQISLSSTTYTQNFDSMGSTGTDDSSRLDGGFDPEHWSKWNLDGRPGEHRHGDCLGRDSGCQHRQLNGWRQLQFWGRGYESRLQIAPSVRLRGRDLQRDTYVSFTNATGLSIAQLQLRMMASSGESGRPPVP